MSVCASVSLINRLLDESRKAPRLGTEQLEAFRAVAEGYLTRLAGYLETDAEAFRTILRRNAVRGFRPDAGWCDAELRALAVKGRWFGTLTGSEERAYRLARLIDREGNEASDVHVFRFAVELFSPEAV